MSSCWWPVWYHPPTKQRFHDFLLLNLSSEGGRPRQAVVLRAIIGRWLLWGPLLSGPGNAIDMVPSSAMLPPVTYLHAHLLGSNVTSPRAGHSRKTTYYKTGRGEGEQNYRNDLSCPAKSGEQRKDTLKQALSTTTCLRSVGSNGRVRGSSSAEG